MRIKPPVAVTGGLLLRCLGESLLIDAAVLTDPERHQLAALWARCAPEPASGRPALPTDAPADVRLVRCSTTGEAHQRAEHPLLVDVTDWSRAPYRISRAVTLAALRRRAGQTLLFHAGGLAAPDGTVAVLLGPSGAGKSTAVRELGRSLGYVSDEAVAVDHDGTVHAYPKPLSIVAGTNHKQEISPDDAGLLPAPAHLRLGRIVLLNRSVSHEGEPELEPLGLLEAIAQAAAQTSGLIDLDAPLDTLGRALVVGGSPMRLRYREARDCSSALRRILADESASPVTWTRHPPEVRDPRNSPHRAERLGWVRHDYVDAIATDGRVLVLQRGRTSLLDGLGAVAWLTAAHETSEDEIVKAARATFGHHAEAAERVRATLRQLRSRRLLQAPRSA